MCLLTCFLFFKPLLVFTTSFLSFLCGQKIVFFFGLVNEYPLESLWLINTFSWSCNFGRYKLGLRIYRRLWLSRYTICFSMQRGVSLCRCKNHDFHCEMSPFLTALPINNPISYLKAAHFKKWVNKLGVLTILKAEQKVELWKTRPLRGCSA